ncbi:MAG: hypothetical protein EXR65_03210 [Dehalococcoidia bacterium]|nr:hypothetical protein [Dehalococcoidia bacterium]
MPCLRRSAATATIALMIALVAPAAAQQPAAPTVEQLKNLEYPTEHGRLGTAKLVNGRFELPAARVTMIFLASATGTIGGQPAATVHLATNSGGSGTFSDLYVVGAALRPVGPLLLGDRVRNVTLSIERDRIVVSMITQSPGEPLCCGTLQVTRSYQLQGDRLVDVSGQSAPTAPPGPPTTGSAGLLDGAGTALPPLAQLALLATATACVLGARARRKGGRPGSEARGKSEIARGRAEQPGLSLSISLVSGAGASAHRRAAG